MLTLNITKDDFEKFYSSEIKVIVSNLDRETIKKLALPSALQVYELDLSIKSDGLIRPFDTQKDGDGIPLTVPPQFCIALLAFSRQGQNELMHLIDWWSRVGIDELPIDYDEEKDNPSDLNNVLINCLKDKWCDTAKHATMLQRQLASLRTAHEELQNVFAGYEDFLSHARIPPVQLRFSSEPTDEVAVPGDSRGNPITFVQRLPISSRGLAIIELHINMPGHKSEGVLSASVKTLEDPQELASWQIPYRTIHQGWTRLVLPNIWSGPKLTTELHLTLKTHQGKSPTLSLTKLQLLPEACLRLNNNTKIDRSLALRLWTGLPGIRQFYGSPDKYTYDVSSEIRFSKETNGEYFLREGWSEPESGGTWSIGKHARITLMLSNPVDSDLYLIARVKGFVALKKGHNCVCNIYVNNQKLNSWQFNEDKSSEKTATISANLLRGTPVVDISFEILDPKSPSELGQGEDERKLGIHLESIRLEPVSKLGLQARYMLGSEIRFGQQGNAMAYLGDGWGEGEENGTWTVKKRAYISLKVPLGSKGPLSLRAKAKGYVVPKINHTCKCHVFVNNQKVAVWHFKNDKIGEQTARIDDACLKRDSTLNIFFEFPDLKSPEELGMDHDIRKLGMYVQSIWIRPK